MWYVYCLLISGTGGDIFVYKYTRGICMDTRGTSKGTYELT